ncbi:uncharacterized protein LOC132251605 [Alligator mississippiensis]|uniref:uncharacterized protein LOC132251605 n=1 Tax=Alligator mississippiensis TaxID=8496 RepID=UPI002877F724|nr:uncharacterized protein LOC132251605 [Alligator mississippiensis]XP_059587528.1 uncharacterized protein LOC132251605 [Alligator mississippiensis]
MEKSSAELQVTARPELSGIQVLPRWDPPDQVPFAVRLHGFYPRGIHRIAWSWDGDGAGREEPPDISPDPDGTFTATSVWRVPSRSLTGPGLRVRVCVQHGPADPPLETELLLGDAGVLQPRRCPRSPRPAQWLQGGVTLRCRIAGHFPAQLSVAWLRKLRHEAAAVTLQDSGDCRIRPGTAGPAPHGNSFQQERRLSLAGSTSSSLGAQYICRVGHVTLGTPVERSSGLPRPMEEPQISESKSVPAGRGVAAGHSPRQSSTPLKLSTKPVPATPQTVPERRGTAAHTSSGEQHGTGRSAFLG